MKDVVSSNGDELNIVDAVLRLSRSVGRIAAGESSPDGLEAVAMALAGDGMRHPVGEGLADIASAIRELADAVREWQK